LLAGVCVGSHRRQFAPEELKEDLGIRDEAIGDSWQHCPLSAGDAIIISPHVVHSVGSNLGRTTICALLLCYKDAAAVDLQPGGNKRSLAELPIARGGQVCPLFPAGYVEQLYHDDGLEARL